MIGGAILPSLLHQDPRYFYQGTGTNESRTLHALSYPFVCKGDNGHPKCSPALSVPQAAIVTFAHAMRTGLPPCWALDVTPATMNRHA